MKQVKTIAKKATITDYEQGLSWYSDAYDYALEVSEMFGTDFLKTCGIISALSPSVSWEQNKRDAMNLIAYLSHGLDRPVCATYGNNVSKAEDIFYSDGKRETIEKILYGIAGFKTHAFFLNMSHLDVNAVTVDRHIVSALGFDMALTKKRYYDISAKVQRTAKEMGMYPMDLQATIWIRHKRVNQV